ncbi:MAG: phage tail sheath family protein, partial [Deltaproteobacteria bacterium]|nr:phage tail sheath family protein [Deltaproteobacteria bacterium]
QLLNHTSGIHSYTSSPGWAKTWNDELSPDAILEFVAADTFDFAPGTWGDSLRARVDYDVPPDGPAFPTALAAAGLLSADLFNLTVRDMKSGISEVFRNVSTKAGARHIGKVLENESGLVTAKTVAGKPETSDDGLTGDDLKVVPFSPLDTKRTSGVKAAGDDGDFLSAAELTPANAETARLGLFALEQLYASDGLFNLLCIPPYLTDGGIDAAVAAAATAYCEKRRAIFIMDPPAAWTDKAKAVTGISALEKSRNAAVFFPRLKQPNILKGGQVEVFAPCGAVAGIFARTDSKRGVWKAPAGLEANLIGVPELSVGLTDDENGELNPKGINCLRAFPTGGRVVWGSRTLRGDDGLADEYKYIPVRRTALFIEESLFRGTQWVVFEPNDEPLWAQIRLNLGAFMNNLFRQGAFQGKTPREAYFVKCDKETTTQNDIDLGIVNIHVGFAPLKPAEFVVLKIQQIAGAIDV